MSEQASLFSPLASTNAAVSPEEIKFDLETFKNKNYLTHNFHPYPAKFVPQIPRTVILALSRVGETILDPFCGSGTSLVEASILGRKAIGLDINPLACLVSHVKTSPLTCEDTQRVLTVLRKTESLYHNTALGSASTSNSMPDRPSAPDFLNRDHWFEPHVQVELAAIRDLIWHVPAGGALDFLKVAFSAIIVKVSNQESDTRWVAIKKQIPPGGAIRAFLSKAHDMLGRAQQLRDLKPIPPKVHVQSVTEPFPFATGSIDLVVTSPPYLNSYDYYLYHKLRFYWLGLDHYSVQAQELGSRNRHSDKAEGIETYTEGILSALEETFRVLKPGRHLCIVIGDSILRGRIIEMNELYRSLAEKIGFSFVHSFSYDQRKYTSSFSRNFKTTFKQSHIIFFVRPP